MKADGERRGRAQMSEWRQVTLGQIAEESGGFIRTGPFGSQLHQSDYVADPDGIPVIMPRDMAADGVDRERINCVSTATADRLNAHQLEPGDVVLARRGDVGRFVFIEGDQAGWLCGTGSMRVHVPSGDRVAPRYLKYAMAHPSVRDWLTGQAVGATMPNLNAAIVGDLPVWVGPLAQQAAVASVLFALDELIELNGRRIEVLEDLARSLYREWFLRFRFPGHEHAKFVDSDAGPIPDGWSAQIAAELIAVGMLEVGDGYRAKNAEFAEDGLPFIRIANLREGRILTEACDRLPLEYESRLGPKVSRMGDVVVSTKGTVGRFTAVTDYMPRMVYSPQISYWRSLAPALAPAYLRSWIGSDDFTRQCAVVKGATDMADYVNLKDQRRMRVLVPNVSTMRAFAHAADPLFAQADLLRAANDVLAATRDLLLPRLVTGKLDISEIDLGVLTPSEAA